MAYVAISGDLINRVHSKISKMRNQEIASDCPNLEKSYTLDATELHNRANWGEEHLHLLNKIPKEWLRQRENACIRVKGTVDLEGVAVPPDLFKNVEFKGLTGAYGRPSTDYWGNSSADITIDELRALPDDMVGRDECIAMFEEAQTEAQIHHRWDKVKDNITAFLHKCKSLNEAVKLFPAVKLYLSDRDIERLETKVQRGPRTELVNEVDTGALTAAALAARLAQPAGSEA